MTRVIQLVDRRPFNSPWVISIVSRYALPAWFAIESILGIALVVGDPRYWLFDGRLYLEATRTWLAGGDPWDVQLLGNYFAAPPLTLLPFVPFALLPPDLGLALVALTVCGGAIATIRLLRLPWWWLLFPPLVQCVLSANVQALIVPLILVPGGALAIVLKIYAGLPLLILGRWRSLLLAAGIVLLTLPILPWERVHQPIRRDLAATGGPVEVHAPSRAHGRAVAADPHRPGGGRAARERPGWSSRPSGRRRSSITVRSRCPRRARSRRR